MQTPFRQNASFREAASTLGFGKTFVEQIENVAVTIFGDLRWTEEREGDECFLRNLQSICDALHSQTLPTMRAITELGRDADFLCSSSGHYHFLKALNFAVMACIEPSMPCALVATVRNEGPFLLEWLAHNRAIGINNIYIYTNNNTDGSTELLQKLAEFGIIKLILNEDSGVEPQTRAYEHSFFLLPELRKFQWLFYLDADEFFIPADQYDFRVENIISAIKSKFLEKLPSCVCYNWNWIGSGGAVRRSAQPVSERFVYGNPHPVVKSLIRPSAVLPNIQSAAAWHIPRPVPGGFGVNSSFEQVGVETADIACNLSGGKINHYWNKSFEEFMIKRQRADDVGWHNREIESFFAWDVIPSRQSFDPFPWELTKRLRSEHEFLLSIPGTFDIVHRVDELYSALSSRICHSDQLAAIYLSGRRRSFIMGCLKHPLSAGGSVELNSSSIASELLSLFPLQL